MAYAVQTDPATASAVSKIRRLVFKIIQLLNWLTAVPSFYRGYQPEFP